MSRRSKERKRLAKMAASQGSQGQLPIVGNFEQRATEIIRQDNLNNNKSGYHNPLPAHYAAYGGGHYINVNSNSDTGYKPIGHEKDKKIFNIKSTDITEGSCPIAKVPKVYVATRLWNEWISLADDYPTEWLAYLTGQFVKDDKGPRYEIRKMYFPPQVAHASHVDVDDDFEGYLPNTIGAIHSHVEMGVFFSGEDLAHSNWPVEIVVNAKGEAKVMIRHQLECGQWIKNYSEILTVGDNADERYTRALDKAFEMGDDLRRKRVAKKSESVGYRTPEPATIVSSSTVPHVPYDPTRGIKTDQGIVTYDQSQEWHFRINGKPHRWRDKDSQYVEVVKVNDSWLDYDDPRVIGQSQGQSQQSISVSGSQLTQEQIDKLDAMDATVEINEETGQITIADGTGHSTDDGQGMVTRPATQEEIDRMMEGEVDDMSCRECNGTGRVIVNGASIEHTDCGGTGVRPEYYMGSGYSC